METPETQDPDHGKKCYVHMIDSHFPSKHPRKGAKTLFEPMVYKGIKIHSFAYNTDEMAAEAVNAVNAGTAFVSLRVWEGKPYHSKTREVKRLYRLGVQKAEATVSQDGSFSISIDGKVHPAPWCIASSEGMCMSDLREWLCPNGKPWSGCIVHFTNHRY